MGGSNYPGNTVSTGGWDRKHSISSCHILEENLVLVSRQATLQKADSIACQQTQTVAVENSVIVRESLKLFNDHKKWSSKVIYLLGCFFRCFV